MYKLKKWYPSLPKAWKKGDIVHKRKGVYVKKSLPFEKSGRVPVFEVENNPEFWEKKEKKDYKILSFINDKGNIKKIKKDGLFYWNWSQLGHTLEFELSTQKDIHSVKRLSDGEVFTVGDDVEHWVSSLRPNSKWSISSFRIVDGIMCVYSGTGFYKKLSEISKKKEPLFTTEDGVDIYEGDRYWYVTDNYGMNSNVANSTAGANFNAQFSTKEKALEYIDEHKPRYSKADIKKAANASQLNKLSILHNLD